MAFKIKNATLERVMGSAGFLRLTNASLPAQISYPLALLLKELREKTFSLVGKQRTLAEQYCDRDDKGNCERRDDGSYFITKQRAAFEPKLQQIMEQEITVNGEKLQIGIALLNEELEKPLTAGEIVDLIPIIDFSFELESEKLQIEE